MTPQTAETVNSLDYLNEFEKSYYLVVKKEFDKLNIHNGFLEEKQAKKLAKLTEQELFLRNMIQNFRCLIEVSITSEIDKINYVEELSNLHILKDNQFRANLLPVQIEFLTNHYNKLKGEISENT